MIAAVLAVLATFGLTAASGGAVGLAVSFLGGPAAGPVLAVLKKAVTKPLTPEETVFIRDYNQHGPYATANDKWLKAHGYPLSCGLYSGKYHA